MQYKLCFFFMLVIILYCLFAIILKLPPFKAARVFKKQNERAKRYTVSNILSVFSKALSKYIPMGMLKQAELEKVLQAANFSVTPKEYLSTALVYSFIFFVWAVPFYFINPILAFIPLAFSGYIFSRKYNQAFKSGDQRKQAIEKELPRFVSYMANTLKSNRNLIDMIDVYKTNYNSPLTEELSITVADMRTGNQEIALQHLETRVNSELMGELIRGLLSSLRGNDMSVYFDNLSYKLTTVCRQRLMGQAQKKEPKISMMSYLVFGCAIVTIFVVLGAILFSSFSMVKA